MEHPWTGGLSFPNDIALGPLDDPGYLQKKLVIQGLSKVQPIWLIPIICKTYKVTEGPFLQKAVLS